MSDRPKSESRGRNNFDGLRLCLALVVVWGHQDNAYAWFGRTAVLAFFVISGYLVSESWLADPSLWRFFLRRFLRVWPALAAVVTTCAAGAWIFASGPWQDIQRMAAIFYLRNLWLHGIDWSFFPRQPTGMNGSLWMLPFEIDLYAALALAGLAGKRAMLAAAAMALSLSLFAAPEVARSTQLGTAWSLQFAGFFGAGVLLREFVALRDVRVLCICAGAGAALSLVSQPVALLLIVPASVAWIGPSSWPFLRRAARFGDLSFGVYLWGWPVQQVTRLWLDPAQPALTQFAAVVPQVLAAALVSWHLIERPSLRLKPRRPVPDTS